MQRESERATRRPSQSNQVLQFVVESVGIVDFAKSHYEFGPQGAKTWLSVPVPCSIHGRLITERSGSLLTDISRSLRGSTNLVDSALTTIDSAEEILDTD